MDDSRAARPKHKIDWPSALMALVACLALAWVAWLRFRPESVAPPLRVGAPAPVLRLLDLTEGEPLLLAGLRGRVVWVVFWSAHSQSAPHDLRALEAAWQRLKLWHKFALVAAAVDVREPGRVQAALDEANASLPAYLAAPETARAFGAGEQPLHVLLDEDGRVIAVARGCDAGTIGRLIRQIEARLQLIEPRPRGRFAIAVTIFANVIRSCLAPQ